MKTPQERLAQVVQFRGSLEKVVELGYGDRQCEDGIRVMYEEVVRKAVPSKDRRELPFGLPVGLPKDQNTYASLLTLCTQLQHYVEHMAAGASRKSRKDPVLFPFMTTLGLSGGVFLLSFHVARITHTVLQYSVSG